MPTALDWQDLETCSPLLAALPASARRAAQRNRLGTGELLFRIGDRPLRMYFVVTGEMRLVRRSRAGGEIILQRTRQGFFAEPSLHQPRYHCDGVAAAPSELLSIPRKVVVEATEDVAFREAWLAQLSVELRRARAQCERLNLRTARERIVHYLESEGDDGRIALRVSKKDWAGELGLTHEALYRALRQMTDHKELAVEGPVIRLIGARS